MKKEMTDKTMQKKIWIFLSALLLAVLLSAMTVSAAPKVKKAEYEGKGKVEIEFRNRVQYRNLKISVTDTAGKKYVVQILDRDKDDVEFLIKKYKTGMIYFWKISGIRQTGETSYKTLSGKVSIPKTLKGIPLKEVEYDAKDKEVSFAFDAIVQWKNPKVIISDGKKNYVVRIKERNKKEIEVKVKSLKKGIIYTYRISGIRKKGASNYMTISDTFRF